ncbi:MAG: S-methyl-5'-thioadenosine phosphorylase [Candidatus Thorarchaeota archaeon]
MSINFGIIGGSGLYNPKNILEQRNVRTPFGKVLVKITEINAKKIAFLARHGEKHSVPPHLINYNANIFALHKLGVRKIIASSAVGAIEDSLKPGDLVLPDQFIDFTLKRPRTFFDGKFKMILHSGEKRSGVVHIDFTQPYCNNLRNELMKKAENDGSKIFPKGTYICTEGPRFETPAEIDFYRKIGGAIVGMTSATECVLAKELGMCYATICLVTNYAAGMQAKISIEEVFSIFKEKGPLILNLIEKTFESMEISEKQCECL